MNANTDVKEGAYLEMCHACLMPKTSMLEELAWFFTNLSAKSIESSSVLELKQKLKEEFNIACGVDKVSTSALVLWLPYLNRHAFSKDLLGKLMFRS